MSEQTRSEHFYSLHPVQNDVAEFHRALDIPIGDSPAIRRPELRAELIREEARETVEAIERGDLVEAIDGLCDLLCVTYGAACEFGVDLAPFWDEVHRTNMAKRGGPVRADGKRLKPPGWTPPDIAGVLAGCRNMSPSYCREEINLVICPKCGASPGQPCFDMRVIAGPAPYRHRWKKIPHSERRRRLVEMDRRNGVTR